MKQHVLSVLKFLVLLAIAFGLLVYAFRGISVGKIIHEMLQANMFWVFLSVVVSLIAFVSRSYRWNLLIEPLGYKPKLKNTAYSLMVGYFANFAFPRLGEVTRCGSLSKAESIPFNVLLGTVIVERVIDVISLLICLLLTAIIEYQRLGSFLITNIFHPLIEKLKSYATVPIISIAVIVLALVVIFSIRFIKKTNKQEHESKITHLIKGLISGLRSVGKLEKPGAFIFHSILIWVLYFFMPYLCFFALPATSHLSMGAGLFILVVGGLGMSAPVQGGIGAYHLLVSQGLMLYGISQQDGLAFATLIHTSQIIVVVVFGSLSFLLLFLGNKKVATTKKFEYSNAMTPN